MNNVMAVGDTWKWGDTYWKVIALYRMPNGRDVARLRSISNGRNKKVWADEHPGWVKYEGEWWKASEEIREGAE